MTKERLESSQVHSDNQARTFTSGLNPASFTSGPGCLSVVCPSSAAVARRLVAVGDDPRPGSERIRFPPAGAVAVAEQKARSCTTMAEQLYLENIDEFVTDQNKIVRSWDPGRQIQGVLGLPGLGGSQPGAYGFVGPVEWARVTATLPWGRQSRRQSLSRAPKSAGPGRASGALGGEPGKLAGLVRPPPGCPIGCWIPPAPSVRCRKHDLFLGYRLLVVYPSESVFSSGIFKY